MKVALSFVIVLLGLVMSPLPTHCLTTDFYQAEDGVSLGGVSTETGPYSGYTGNGYVDFTGGQGAFLLWDVNAIVDGDYNIVIRYASPTKRPLDLCVDSVKQLSGYEILPTSNWNDWREESVKVRLSVGSHQIKVVQLTEKGPNVDWMSVEGPLDGRSTVLEPGQVLRKTDFLYSHSGLFKVGLDESGQFVIQEESSSTVIWSSGHTGGQFCYMQIDGNLVVRDGKLLRCKTYFVCTRSILLCLWHDY
jgi:Carbohydrate binding module (family 6)